MKQRDIDDYYRILKRDISEYLELKINFFKLEFIETFSSIFGKLVAVWVSIMIGVIFLTFMLIALGFYLGKLLHGYHWGFLIVGGIFMIIAILFVLLKDKIITNPLIKAFVMTLFEDYSAYKNDKYEKEKTGLQPNK